MVKPFSSITDAVVPRIMDWRHFFISSVIILLVFLGLAFLWYDLVDDEFFDVRLHTITVTPEDKK